MVLGSMLPRITHLQADNAFPPVLCSPFIAPVIETVVNSPQAIEVLSVPLVLFLPQVVQTFEGRPDHLIYRSVNVMAAEEASAKNLPHLYVLPGTDGAADSVSTILQNIYTAV